RETIANSLDGGGIAGASTCNCIHTPAAYVSKNTATFDVCKFDLAAANAELDKAGYTKGSDGFRSKGGVPLKVLFQTTVSSLRQSAQAIVKAAWEKIGVQVELKSVPSSSFFSPASPDSAGHFYADVEMHGQGYDPDPTTTLASLFGCASVAGKANNWNGLNE